MINQEDNCRIRIVYLVLFQSISIRYKDTNTTCRRKMADVAAGASGKASLERNNDQVGGGVLVDEVTV